MQESKNTHFVRTHKEIAEILNQNGFENLTAKKVWHIEKRVLQKLATMTEIATAAEEIGFSISSTTD